MIPSLSALKQFSQMLSSHNIAHTLGGSGLLFALGGSCSVNDWDLTLETSWDLVKPLLIDMKYEYVNANGKFATDFLCKVVFQETNFDLINHFAIKVSDSIYKMPMKVTGHWNGVPLGCPIEWVKAYDLMGRSEKVKMLQERIEVQKPIIEVAQEELDKLCSEIGHHCHSHE